MTDPLGLATDLVKGILSRVAEVKTNQEECKLLACLAEKTLPLLETLHAKELSDPSATQAVEFIHDALKEANKVVEDCYKAAFFSALLRPESYSVPLRHAAEKLDHAVSQIPLVSISMVAEIQSDMAALCEQLRQAKFNEKATMAHETMALKKELDKAFHQRIQESDEVKTLIRELMKQRSSSNDELRSELAKLQMNASEARMAKEKQQEFELNQIIAVFSESLDFAGETQKYSQDLRECLRCPISKEVMSDPVILKDSGMAYDRSSILEWISQGHRYDPLTNVELISKDLVPNPALRDACQILSTQYGVTSSASDNPQLENIEDWIEPGLYEGHGKLTIGTSTIHACQLLILGPDRVVVGSTLYTGDYFETAENNVEVGSGQWNRETNEVSFMDTHFKYSGNVGFGKNKQRRMEWRGKISKVEVLDEEHSFIIKYSPPPISYEIPMHPTILELKGELPRTSDNIKYSSKLLLGLERNSTVDGWITFESSHHQNQFTGRVLNGKWDESGTLQFLIYFSLDDTPLNSESNPTNYEACFKVVGSIDHGDSLPHPTFGGRITKVQNEAVMGKKKTIFTPLEGVQLVEYAFIREASTPWYFLHPLSLRLFQMSRGHSRNVDRANLDVGVYSFPIGGRGSKASSSSHTSVPGIPAEGKQVVKKEPDPTGHHPKDRSWNLVLEKKTPHIKHVYEFEKVLGHGQFSTTQLVFDKETGVKYACKSISKRKIVTRDDTDDVRREIEILKYLNGHPNVCEFQGAFEDQHNVHIVLELCTGGELFDRIVQRGHYSEKDAAECVRTMLRVVQHCHDFFIIHRDLKPENFLLVDESPDAALKAIDFELATFFEEGRPLHQVVGTAYYVAPEVLRKKYSKEADIWSCGVILYILLSGYPPFYGETEYKIFDAILKGTFDLVSDPWPYISDAAKECVNMMLVQDVSKRATAPEILKHDWLREDGVASEKPLNNAVVDRLKGFTAMNKFKKEALKVIAVNLPKEEIQGMENMFKNIDCDHSGTITVDEFKQMLQTKGSFIPDSELNGILSAVDIDGNGVIDYEEFLAATMNLHAMSLMKDEEKLMKAFKTYDTNRDGAISLDELKEALLQHAIDDAEVEQILADVDTNNDGQIDFDEFRSMMLAL